MYSLNSQNFIEPVLKKRESMSEIYEDTLNFKKTTPINKKSKKVSEIFRNRTFDNKNLKQDFMS